MWFTESPKFSASRKKNKQKQWPTSSSLLSLSLLLPLSLLRSIYINVHISVSSNIHCFFSPARSIVVCDQLSYPAHWTSLVPGPEGIIRFGNAEDKLMLISMHVHAHPHADNARAPVHARHIFGLCKWVSHSAFEMYRRKGGWRSVSAEINTGFSQRTCANLWKLDTTQKGLFVWRASPRSSELFSPVLFFLTFQEHRFWKVKRKKKKSNLAYY